jgi:hypothetical protein
MLEVSCYRDPTNLKFSPYGVIPTSILTPPFSALLLCFSFRYYRTLPSPHPISLLIQCPAYSSGAVSVFVLFEEEIKDARGMWPGKLESHDGGVLIV